MKLVCRLIIIVVSLSFQITVSYAQFSIGASNDDEVSYACGVLRKLDKSGKIVGSLDKIANLTLPVGIAREVNGKRYVIAIDSVRYTASIATFNAYIQISFAGDSLIFGAKNIAFNPGGISATNGTKLVLLNSHTIPINDKIDLILPGDGSNFIEWDCNGFKSASLQGQFQFDSSWIKPADPKVKELIVTLKATATDLQNILATVNIPEFVITKTPDFSFKAKNVTVDMSDVANPVGMRMSDIDLPASDAMLWHGFFIEELNVQLPKQMSKQGGYRPSVTAKNFIIDDQGVSGLFTGDNIINLGDASANGWGFSVDKIGVELKHNRFVGGAMGGLINIGFLGDDPLRYDAVVSMRNDNLEYTFGLTTTKDKTYSCFLGNITIDANSRIQIAKTENDFIPSATLNGKVSFNQKLIKIPDIGFQNLALSTKSPYVHSGEFDLKGTVATPSIAGFSIALSNLELGLLNGKVSVGGAAKISLMEGKDNGFSGSTSFLITALQKEEIQTFSVDDNIIQKVKTSWNVDKVTVNDIVLSAKVLAFSMDGSLSIFEDHPIYHNGFRGSLSFELSGIIKKSKAVVYFGNKDNYKYWSANVYVGANMSLGPLSITGLLGGLSYHMERPAQFDPFSEKIKMDNSGLPKDMKQVFDYIPSQEAGMGFVAGATLGLTGMETAFNATVMLNVQLTTSGAFRYAQFDGAGYFMKAPKDPLSNKDTTADESAPVWAKLYMRYDRDNSTFYANMKTYVNVAGGLLRGVNERGLVGEAVIYSSPDDWYVYIGRPSKMMGLTVAGLATVQAYFMMGNHVEDMPPLPSEVGEILGMNTDFMDKENKMSTGKGFGFGAHFKASFAFNLLVYGEFSIGAGADILLRNYGEARCKGSNEPIGINGWYASGQAYAFVKGEVGIRVKLFVKKINIKIASLAAAALLQAKAPNPAWFRGAVGVKYDVLGGLIKGSATIKVQLGSECEIVGAKEIDVEIINEIKPDQRSSDVSVFATPQAAFNLAVEKPFSMLNEYDQVATYRVKLSELKLKDDNKGDIPGAVKVEEDGKSASITSRDILPPNSSLTASVKVYLEKQIGDIWAPLKNANGTVDYETKSTSFTTGEAPDNISWGNIAFSYPLKQQYNFYPKEYNKGYIKLKRGQPNLFETIDAKGGKWQTNGLFTDPAGRIVPVAVAYDVNNAMIYFDIPESLAGESIYKFTINRKSLSGEAAAKNVTTKAETSIDENGDTTSVVKNALKGVASSGNTKEVISYHFRSSRYATFTDKVNAMLAPYDVWDIATNYKMVIGKRLDAQETFDKYELDGDMTYSSKPLVQLKAGEDCEWLQNKIIPLIYNDDFKQAGIHIQRSNDVDFGMPPLYAMRLYNNDDIAAGGYTLTDAQISEGVAPSKFGRVRYMYYVSLIANDDYHDLLNKAGNLYLQNSNNTAVRNLMQSTFPELTKYQNYPVEISYRLPGINTITSTIKQNIYFK